MGYDIYSMREDREKSLAFAKKATPWVFGDNDEAPDYWRNTAYYRMNIGGMVILRKINELLGVAFLNEALWDNSGTVIRDWECFDAWEILVKKDDLEIRAAVIEALSSDEHASFLIDKDGEIQGWIEEVRHWQEYLHICSDLKGCEVL
jgi:hypothetical protein